MTPQELKLELEKRGWKLAPEISRTGVDWYAWKSMLSASDCTCNEKPPSMIIKPWEIVTDTNTWRSVEFAVTGEIGGDIWVKFTAYSIPMDDAILTIPKAHDVLLAAWNAAANCNAVLETSQ